MIVCELIDFVYWTSVATELINKLNQQDVWNRINDILIHFELEFCLYYY